MQGIDHMLLINMKIKRVIRVFGVMRMTLLCLGPRDDFARILQDGFSRGNGLHSKHPFAMHAGAPGLDAATGVWGNFIGHF